VYQGSDNANNAIIEFVFRAQKKIDSCISAEAPSVIIEVDSIKEKRIDAVKSKGLEYRFVTEITKDNVNYVKELLTFSKVRHLKGLKGNFEVADEKEYVAVASLQKSRSIPLLIFSNLPEIVEQQQFIFDSFWNKATPAEQRIKEIEEGIAPQITTIISDYEEVMRMEFEMIRKAKKEIQIMYSTVNAYYIQEHSGTLNLLKDMAEHNSELSIRILTPLDSSIKQSLSISSLRECHNIHIQDIAPSISIKIKSLIVDRKESMIMEFKHPIEDNLSAASGYSIYSNSESTVSSYASIFEVLYNQSILFEQLRQDDNIKSEFINVAAHELRTPIMPILNGMEILEEKLAERKKDFEREIDIITRNASRLQNLAESILQVSKIESGSFNINIQNGVDLHNLISQVIEDIEKKYAYTDKTNRVSVLFLPFYEKDNNTIGADVVDEEKKDTQRPISPAPIYVDCDPQKVSQVVFNLLDNSMKFTTEGKIIVSTSVNAHSHGEGLPKTPGALIIDDDSSKTLGDKKGKSNIIVSVQDTGIGINPSIKDQLFEKFATKSKQGTGLGLYLSKKIVEAHGGKIWFEESKAHNSENSDGGKIGTQFKFSLPLSGSTKGI
jgi:two-component system, OmpR family, sensor histidine kinase VicK